MEKNCISVENPKHILRQIVVEEHGHNPTEFSKRCHYTYAHAWQLLEGEAEVTDATLGRFLRAYGVKAAGRVAAAMPALDTNGA